MFDFILFDNDTSTGGHNQFLHIIEHKIGLDKLSINFGKFVIINISSDNLCKVPDYDILTKTTHYEHLFVSFPFIKFGWQQVHGFDLAELQMLEFDL